MKKTGFAIALAAMLALPSMAAAAPTKEDTKAASKECHDLIEGSNSQENFESLTDFKSFGECVSSKRREEAAERRAAKRAAREACAGLKGTERRDCVATKAKKAKARKDAKDQARIEGAETCAADQEADADAFGETYGTKRNAFRKCVKAQMNSEDDES